ncbi:BA75_02317T0 [Komagataella pastoris]|uniref:BA75_02317T0 n=1 Tax=Komagataella pastoris TaxID=4922 RepID=A0A1B2JBD2_PICPA|nr:BA75_02317T0 [Komagataella pastoris]
MSQQPLQNSDHVKLEMSGRRPNNSLGSRFSWVKRLMNSKQNSPPYTTIPLTTRSSGKRADMTSMKVPRSQKTHNKMQDRHSTLTTDIQDSITDNSSTVPILSLSSASLGTSSLLVDDNKSQGSSLTTSLSPSAQLGSMSLSLNGTPASNAWVLSNHDAASIVTLASSTRNRARRPSFDTNASTSGIAPSSLNERISAVAATGTHESTQNPSIDGIINENDLSHLHTSRSRENSSVRSIKSHATTRTGKS